ncbi:Transporter, MFS superfamily [Bifidobacterium actinocoloniiforme DSM 22766]|uniref:Transporter, MFS superfamily n=1 Tax=Bifidobacterium actinocoloniiforme DSM 22766 TaxID=1437605 RepID=A0A086YZE7_9BIFI|nr:MFS transporter [Bifidobacterium actinocoloniiforme]AKV54984.1 membrane protein with transport function [Bifidobacterium actinocoloniiforme DSM 22766]KFI39647.1 Transporter, MFS superfamily [Bifidobacterium actinocoloniiforme DSM 22766]
MSQPETTAQAPQRSGKGSTLTAARYIIGLFIYNTLLYVGFTMVASVLMPQRLKDIGIADPSTLLGQINSVGAVLSMFINVFIGAMSDRTRSRFGRRTPWIVSGAVLTGVCFYATGLPTLGIGVGIAYCVSLIGLNMMIAPITAILSDRVPDKDRATASAAFGGGAVIGQGLGTLLASAFISSTTTGFLVSGISLLLAGWLSMAIIPREPSNKTEPRKDEPIGQVIVHAFTPPIKGASDFWKAFLCRTGLLVAYQMITSYQLYILEDHIGQTKTQAAGTIATMSVITMVVSLIATALSGPISDLIKRRKPPIVFACALYAIGIAMPWVLRSSLGMLLFAGIAGFGYGMYSAVDQALNVDVLPNKETAGKDLGFINIATCAGQAIGSVFTSTLVAIAGGYSLVFPVAIAMTVVSAVCVMLIKRVK